MSPTQPPAGGGLRCTIPWPHGAKCAVSISWDIDIDTTLHLERPASGFQEYELLSSSRYEEVAIKSVVDALAELGLRQTFFVCGWCIERYPDTCALIRDAGHEVAHHGYMHEPPNEQSPHAELHWLERGVDIIRAFTGRSPLGWRAPYAAFSSRSASYLARMGFVYDSSLSNDHNPYLITADEGSLLELPIDITMSDAPHYAHVPTAGYAMSPKTPAQAIDYFMSVIDATYEIGGFTTTVWHPELSGRPARLLAWFDMVRALQSRGDVWLAPLGEIAEHVGRCVSAGQVELRSVALPFYREPLFETGVILRGQGLAAPD